MNISWTGRRDMRCMAWSCLTAPRPLGSWNGSGADVQVGVEFLEDRRREPLSEDIGVLGACRYMKNVDVAESNTLSHKMQIDLNMFRPLMLDGIS